MTKTMILLIIGILAILLISGCSKGTTIPSSMPINPPQDYVGGGCSVNGLNEQEIKQSPIISSVF